MPRSWKVSPRPSTTPYAAAGRGPGNLSAVAEGQAGTGAAPEGATVDWTLRAWSV
jgi:hypothetical protein